jgi:mannitol-1-phosphate/altronate dehydrogenase
MTYVIRLTVLFKDFRFRQRFMTGLLSVLAAVFLFYAAGALFGNAVSASATRSAQLKERIENVKTRIARIEKTAAGSKVLSAGLLTHVQSLGERVTGGGKFTNIKLVNTALRQEQVTFKTENLVYNDFVNILKEFESYDNIQLKSLSVNKRFDNPKRIDAVWDVARTMP